MKKLFSLVAAIVCAGLMMAQESVIYTLTPTNGSNNQYAGNCDITIGGITWNLTGNSQMNPWRIGGKSLTGVDRELYSKTAITSNVTKIDVEHGSANDITVNSWTVTVASDADFTEVISTITPAFDDSATVTITRPEGADWSNAYYKFTYNVTVEATSNKFLQFVEAKFYAEGEPIAPVSCDWESISFLADGAGAGAYNDMYKGCGENVTFVNIQPKNEQPAIYLNVPVAIASTSFDAEGSAIEGAGMWVFLSALEEGENAFTVTDMNETVYNVTILYVAPAPVPQNLGHKTIAEFLALQNEVDTCILTGVVSNIVNTTYGNFDLVDETGTVYVYGLLTAAGESRQFASMNIEAGDTLTILALYSTYNGNPQVKNGIFVSVVKPGAPVVTEGPTAAAVAPTYPANQVKAIYSSTYNADCNFADWGSGTQYTQDTYGKKFVTTDAGYFGLEGFGLNCVGMENFHMDVWSDADMTLRIVPIWGGAEQGITKNIVAGQWNSIEVALTEWDQVTNWGNIAQVKIDQAPNATFWVNNIYFYTTDADFIPELTCAQINKAVAGTTCRLNEATVAYVNGKYTYVKDASGMTLIYKENLGLTAGQVVSGIVGNVSIYNGLPELVPTNTIDDWTVTEGEAPEFANKLSAPVAADVNMIYNFTNVTAEGEFVEGTSSNITATIGGNPMTLRSAFKQAFTFEADKEYNVLGAVAIYNSNVQVYFISAEEAEPVGPVDHMLYGSETYPAIDKTWFANTAWQEETNSTAVIEDTFNIRINIVDEKAGQWQSQIFVNPGFTWEVGAQYKMEFDLTTNNQLGGVTIKINDSDAEKYYYSYPNDNVFLADQLTHFVAEEINVNTEPINGGQLIFSIGWCPANTNILISNISIVKVGDATPATEITAPATPTHMAENVYSIFGYYGNSWTSMGWGSVAAEEMAGSAVIKHYTPTLGWDIFAKVDEDGEAQEIDLDDAFTMFHIAVFVPEEASIKLTFESAADTDPKTAYEVTNLVAGWNYINLNLAEAYPEVSFNHLKYFIIEGYSLEAAGKEAAVANAYFYKVADAVENVNLNGAEMQKMIIDGQLYIIRDGHMYDATGVIVR